mmetsp:Transcript_27454/g.88661  ORF Transcript_27454/g.88661 Transcript_27454/m.88661 type:complete len:202 (+) Transcript_27454:560-1165(+)
MRSYRCTFCRRWVDSRRRTGSSAPGVAGWSRGTRTIWTVFRWSASGLLRRRLYEPSKIPPFQCASRPRGPSGSSFKRQKTANSRTFCVRRCRRSSTTASGSWGTSGRTTSSRPSKWSSTSSATKSRRTPSLWPRSSRKPSKRTRWPPTTTTRPPWPPPNASKPWPRPSRPSTTTKTTSTAKSNLILCRSSVGSSPPRTAIF